MSNLSPSGVKKIVNDRQMFRISFIVCSFFQMITFIDYVSFFFTAVFFFWGVYLLIKYYIKDSRFKSVEYSQFFILFALIMAATFVFNIASGFIASGITFCYGIMNLIYFFLFFAQYTEDIKKIKREIRTVALLIMIITSVCALIGLVLLAVFHRAIWINDRSLIIFENRFKGIYSNPNPQAFASFTGIVSCILLRCEAFAKSVGKRTVKRRIIYLCMFINLLSLMLSVSNSGLLILAVFLFGCVCYRIFAGKTFLSGRKIVYKMTVFLLCCGLILSGLLAVRTGINYVSGVLISGQPMVSSGVLAPTKEQLSQELQPSNGNVTFQHINETLDSGRFKLYAKAIKKITENPVLGTGYGNIVSGGLDKRGRFFDYHNSFLTLAVSNGLPALALILVLGLLLVRRMSVAVFRLDFGRKDAVLPYLVFFIYAYSIYACVEPALLYYPTYNVAYFWMILGAAFALVKDTQEKVN